MVIFDAKHIFKSNGKYLDTKYLRMSIYDTKTNIYFTFSRQIVMNKNHEDKKHKLTIFLIKEEYKEIDYFINTDGFKIIDIKNGDEELGKLLYKGGFKSEPPWVSIFAGQDGFNTDSIYNQSSKAIFLHLHKNRWFCFTFGYARHLIDEHAYERNFGLITALNMGNPSAITSIDKTNISHVSLHTKEQATKEIELSNFEFNNDIDILKSITAKISKNQNEEEETLSGRDSVTICTRVSINTFPTIAERLYSAFHDTKYKELYPWVDKIREERDSTTIEYLDKLLISNINEKNFDKVWIAIPEIIQWEEIDGFTFKDSETKRSSLTLYPELEISTWANNLKSSKPLTIPLLKAKRIYAHNKNGGSAYRWSVYRCLNAEIDLNQNKYILNDGDWYNIEPNFALEVAEYFHAIPDSKINLPPYYSNTEPKYLEFVASQSSDLFLMDQKHIMIGGGRSRVEFCDLYSKNKEIIHVKKYSGSSVLSHLFYQALVSGDSFLHDLNFRKQINQLLPEEFQISPVDSRPDPSQYNICIAIMRKDNGPLDVPFFSKVSFKNTVTSLRKLGFNVYKLKINMK